MTNEQYYIIKITSLNNNELMKMIHLILYFISFHDSESNILNIKMST